MTYMKCVSDMCRLFIPTAHFLYPTAFRKLVLLATATLQGLGVHIPALLTQLQDKWTSVKQLKIWLLSEAGLLGTAP